MSEPLQDQFACDDYSFHIVRLFSGEHPPAIEVLWGRKALQTTLPPPNVVAGVSTSRPRSVTPSRSVHFSEAEYNSSDTLDQTSPVGSGQHTGEKQDQSRGIRPAARQHEILEQTSGRMPPTPPAPQHGSSARENGVGAPARRPTTLQQEQTLSRSPATPKQAPKTLPLRPSFAKEPPPPPIAGPSTYAQSDRELGDASSNGLQPPTPALFSSTPRRRKIYGLDTHLRWYASEGVRRLTDPPTLPSGHTVEEGFFFLHVVTGRSSPQVWRLFKFNDDGTPEWETMQVGDSEYVGDKQYTLSYNNETHVLGWVTPTTVERHSRRTGKERA